MTAPTLTPGKLSRLWLHYQRVSCETSNSDIRLGMDTLEGVVYDCGRVLQLGQDNCRVELKGYLTGDQYLETRLNEAISTTDARYYAEAPNASTIGNPVYGGLIQASEIKVTSPAKGLVAIEGPLMLKTPDKRYVVGNPYRGRLLYNNASLGIAGGTTPINGTAVSMGASIGGIVYVHYTLLWVPPGNSVTIKVQHSANGSTSWTDFSGASTTITAGLSGSGQGVATIAWQETTTDAYWRVVLTPAGSASKTLDIMCWGQYNDGHGEGNDQGDGYELIESELLEWVLDDDDTPIEDA